jgi:intracellular sulfur oxidation DsrE/DsrF family protein
MKYPNNIQRKIDELVNEKQVVIAACNNSLTRLKISKGRIN